MKYLADTHILLWQLKNSPKQTRLVLDLMANPDNTWYLSAISVWEVMIKHQSHPERMPMNAAQFLSDCELSGFLILPFETHHIFEAAKIPLQPKHSDPFDRMLLAQARAEGLTLVTHDRRFGLYDTEPILLV